MYGNVNKNSNKQRCHKGTVVEADGLVKRLETMAVAPSDDEQREAHTEEEDLVLNFGPSEPIHCWKKLSSCEEFVGTKRSKHTIVAWNDRIYVFGGDNGRRMLNDFLVSHIQDSSWARVVFTGRESVVNRSMAWNINILWIA